MTSLDNYMPLISENIEYKASCAMLSSGNTGGIFQMPCSSQTADRTSWLAVTGEATVTGKILPHSPSGLNRIVIKILTYRKQHADIRVSGGIQSTYFLINY